MSAEIVAAPARDRVLWPDLAKGICILLVVLHHTTTKHYVGLVPSEADVIAVGWAGLSHFLKPIRMPLFFVISGLFASSALRRPWRQVAPRVVGHYYLYVVWLLALGAVFAVERTLPMNRTQNLGELASDLVLASTGVWFLYALTVYFVLAKLLRQLPLASVLLPAAVLTVSASALPIDGVNRVSVLVHFVYFLLGSRCPELVWGLARAPRRLLLPALILGYVALAGLLELAGAPSGLRILLLSLLGVPAALVAAAALSRGQVARPLSWVGRRTLPIYVLHMPLLALVQHSPVGFGSASGWTASALAVAYPVVATGAIAICSLLVHRALVAAGLGALFALPCLAGRPDPGRLARLSRQVGARLDRAVGRGASACPGITREPGQGQRADQESEVTQGDVVVVAHRDEVHDDAEQPQGDHIGPELRTQGDQHAGADLDDAHQQHRIVGGARDQVVDPGGEVLIPVGEQSGELVQAERDRRDRKDRTQQQERLVATGGECCAGLLGARVQQ